MKQFRNRPQCPDLADNISLTPAINSECTRLTHCDNNDIMFMFVEVDTKGSCVLGTSISLFIARGKEGGGWRQSLSQRVTHL